MARVLIVDDELSIRETLAEFLMDDGHEVLQAECGAAALTLAGRERFDVVVTDVIMPRMSGVELMERLRALAPNAKLVLITGEPAFETAAAAVRAGAFDYLAKPVSGAEVRRVVRSAALLCALEAENQRYREHLEELVSQRTVQLHLHGRRLAAVAEQTKRLAACERLSTLAGEVLELLTDVVGTDGAAFFVRRGAQIELVSAVGGVCLNALAHCSALARSLDQDPKGAQSKRTDCPDGKGCMLALPLTGEQGISRGVVVLRRTQGPRFDETERELGRLVAAHAGEALQRIELGQLLADSEQRYRQISEHSPTGIGIVQDGLWVMANPRLTQLASVEADALLGQDALSYIHEEDRPLVARAEARALNENARAELAAVRLLRPNQEFCWIQLLIAPIRHGAAPASMWTAIDQTEQARAAEAYRRLASVIECSSEFMGIATLDGRVEYLNEAGRSLVGMSNEEPVTGLTIFDFVDDAGREYIARTVLPRMGEQGEYEGEGTLRRFDTRENFPVYFHVFLVRSPLTGAPQRLAIVMRDISAQKKAEQQRARLEERLRHGERMEAIGRLAGGVAHDFNNILTGILGYAELTHGALPAHSPIRLDVDEIIKGARHAAALTNQLLAFSRKQVIAPKLLDLNEVVEGSRRLLSRIIGEDVTLVVERGEGLGLLRADPAQLEQVLVNLAANARDAMPEGGRLLIRTSSEMRQPESEDEAPRAYTVLTVQDQGVGMDEETQRRIFEPFFSTKGTSKGTGLGLATVYGIVLQNRGFIEVDSALGCGTTLKLFLPKAPEITREERPKATVEPTFGGSETVLLVEDEPFVRSLARRILANAGFKVIEASGGEDALRQFDACPEPIHLLLTDVVMPDMNGRHLAQRLQKRRPLLKVLFMSGYPDDVIAQHGILEEGTEFVQKPFTVGTLTRRVREVLDGRGRGSDAEVLSTPLVVERSEPA